MGAGQLPGEVGMRQVDLLLTSKDYNFSSYSGVLLAGTFQTQVSNPASQVSFKRMVGQKVYEMANHLGNVLVTVTDGRVVLNSGAVVTGYNAVVKSAMDYSAFGVILEGRKSVPASGEHRYDFNGKETDQETDWQDYGFRIYNPRLGKFLSVDPLTKQYPMLTPYQFASNTPIWAIDLDGLEAWYTTDADGNQQLLPNVTGPLSESTAENFGATHYFSTTSIPVYSISDADVEVFANWNEDNGDTEPGACLGCATTGCEMLTGGNGGFRNANGRNNLSGKTVYDLGENLEAAGYATEISTPTGQETTTIINNPNSSGTENTAYVMGPAGAYHSIIVIHNTASNTFSIYDQGTGWDIKDATPEQAQAEIDSITARHPDWGGTRMWQLNQREQIDVFVPVRQP